MSTHNHAPQSLASEVLGIASGDRGALAVLKAYAALTGKELSTDEFIERYDECTRVVEAVTNRENPDLALYELDVNIRDDLITMGGLERIFLTEKTFGNTLFDWPLYQSLYRLHIREKEGGPLDKDQRNALLIGSISVISSEAFKCIANTVYNATPRIIDVESSDTNNRNSQGAFVYGHGLHYVPFQGDTMDIVHTNHLLSMLIPGENQEVVTEEPTSENIEQLFGEAFRVLKPGGHLIMREVTKFDPDDRLYQTAPNQERLRRFGAGVHQALQAIGFEDINIQRATRIIGTEFLFDPERNFDSYPTEQSNGIAVVAQKPSGL